MGEQEHEFGDRGQETEVVQKKAEETEVVEKGKQKTEDVHKGEQQYEVVEEEIDWDIFLLGSSFHKI